MRIKACKIQSDPRSENGAVRVCLGGHAAGTKARASYFSGEAGRKSFLSLCESSGGLGHVLVDLMPGEAAGTLSFLPQKLNIDLVRGDLKINLKIKQTSSYTGPCDYSRASLLMTRGSGSGRQPRAEPTAPVSVGQRPLGAVFS